MAHIGYSPLPPNLSQEIANSIARMNGTAAEQLNAGNCANPRFDPNYRPPGSPTDPLVDAGLLAGGPEAADGSTANGSTASAFTSDEVAAGEAAGRLGATRSAGGGSGDWRKAEPVAYDRPILRALCRLAGVDAARAHRCSATRGRPATPPFVVGRAR